MTLFRESSAAVFGRGDGLLVHLRVHVLDILCSIRWCYADTHGEVVLQASCSTAVFQAGSAIVTSGSKRLQFLACGVVERGAWKRGSLLPTAWAVAGVFCYVFWCSLAHL